MEQLKDRWYYHIYSAKMDSHALDGNLFRCGDSIKNHTEYYAIRKLRSFCCGLAPNNHYTRRHRTVF